MKKLFDMLSLPDGRQGAAHALCCYSIPQNIPGLNITKVRFAGCIPIKNLAIHADSAQ